MAVEANPGHDIGVVTLTGRLVKLQVKKANLKSEDDIKRIYRLAKQVDMDKYYEAKEHLPENLEFMRINNKETLAQVFTDIRYTRKDNEAMSEGLINALKRQGFLPWTVRGY